MNILWTIQDPRPTDAGVYTCEVYAFITGSKKLVIGLQHIKGKFCFAAYLNGLLLVYNMTLSLLQNTHVYLIIVICYETRD